MKNYEEAFKNIREVSENSSYDDKDLIAIDLHTLRELVDKEIELESRKDKLVPGSIWECTASCTAAQDLNFVNIYRNELVIIEKIVVSLVAFRLVTEDEDDGRTGEFVTDIEQFLVCNKPKV